MDEVLLEYIENGFVRYDPEMDPLQWVGPETPDLQ